MIRTQNDWAKKKVQTRVERVRTARMERVGGMATFIPRGVIIPAELNGWIRFYGDYVANSSIALFKLIPEFYVSSSSSCFHEALHAVALASSARQLRQSRLMVLATCHYGKAIAELNVALNDPVLTAEDSVLMTLFILSLYEVRYTYMFGHMLATKEGDATAVQAEWSILTTGRQ